MYQNIYFDGRMIHIWDDKLGYRKTPYKRYAYIKDPYGSHVSLYGDKLKKLYRWSKDTVGLYESDVNPETRTLVDVYTDSDELSVGHKVMYIDIEVEEGYQEIMNLADLIKSETDRLVKAAKKGDMKTVMAVYKTIGKIIK